MRNKFITEISLEDFLKLNLIGYRNERVIVDEHSYRMEMLPIEINKEVLDNVKYCAEQKWNTIVVAIHTDPTEEQIQDHMKMKIFDKHGPRNRTREEAWNFALFDASYLDKWMNHFTGHQTFQIGCGINHLYSTRDYYECHDDYWRVKKTETKAIYMIHLDFSMCIGNKYHVGDSVRINLDMVNDKFKKYNGVYVIEKVRKDDNGVYLYKLRGIPQWGTEDMIIKE